MSSIVLLASACGARSTLSLESDPDAALDEGDAATGPVLPEDRRPTDPPRDEVGECEAEGARGLTLGEPLSQRVGDRSVYLSSMTAGPEGVIAIVEDRVDFTFRTVTLSEDGRLLDSDAGFRAGNGARIAWSAETSSYGLAFVDRTRERLQFEESSLVTEAGSSWWSSELGPEEGTISYLVGPVFAGRDWVVGWRTDERVTVRTVASGDEGGWGFDHRFGADVALAADERSGITFIAVYEPDRPLEIFQMGPDGTPRLPDPAASFDPPIVGVEALSPTGSADDLFVLGVTEPGDDGSAESCLVRTDDPDFASCFLLPTTDERPGVLSSAVLDVRVREMACAAVEHFTPADEAVIDVSCAIDWLDGTRQRSHELLDVADAEDGWSYPDGDHLFGPPWGGLDIAAVPCGYLVAWGDENDSGRINTALLRLSP